MPKIDDLEAVPRRVLNIFYVLDTSGSMQGESIDTLNSAMKDTMNILSEQAASNADAQLKVAVLQFNSGCDWLQPNGPEDAEDFVWSNIQANGITDMGHALKELDSKLTKEAYLKSMTGTYLPVIIFMTDGGSTDDYKSALNNIRKNKWFKRSTKVGFAFGSNPDKKMIAEVVGNSEAVIATADLELFSRLIKFVSTTSSMMCSKVQTNNADVTGADIVKVAADEIGDNPDVQIGAGDGIVVNVPVDTDDDWGDDDWN